MNRSSSSKRWPPQIYTWRVDFEWLHPNRDISFRQHSGGFEAVDAKQARQAVVDQLEKIGLTVGRIAVYANETIVLGSPLYRRDTVQA